jgi:hypothetical protein
MIWTYPRFSECLRTFSKNDRSAKTSTASMRGLPGRHVPPGVRRGKQRGAGFKISDFWLFKFELDLFSWVKSHPNSLFISSHPHVFTNLNTSSNFHYSSSFHPSHLLSLFTIQPTHLLSQKTIISLRIPTTIHSSKHLIQISTIHHMTSPPLFTHLNTSIQF